MKALCNREGLLAAFGMVGGVVPARSPKPILQNIKLVADPDEGSILMATDLEVGIRYRVLGVKVDQPGSADPADLADGVDPADEHRRGAGHRDRGRQPDRARAARGVHAAERGPEPLPRGPRLRGDQLPRRGGGRPEEADPPDDVRHRRREHAVRPRAGSWSSSRTTRSRWSAPTAVAWRGCRRRPRPRTARSPRPGSPVVPVKALKLIERNLDDDDPPVHLAIQSGTAVLVRTERAIIYSRLVEGRFPRYQDVFPSSVEVKIPMEVGPLRLAVEQASIVTSEESRGVDFRFSDGLLRLSSQAADVGQLARRAAHRLRGEGRSRSPSTPAT